MKRLLAFLVLIALVIGALYYWKTGTSPVTPAQMSSVSHAVDEAGDKLKSTKTSASVKAAFELNRQLAPLSIDVSTEGEVVVLRGSVPTAETRALAAKVAASVPDVAQVRNDLQIGGAAPAAGDARTMGENLDDHAVETKVHLAFTLNKDLKGTDISVSSYRKAVTLGGDVASEAQHQTALLVARDTAGVASVTDQIRVNGGAGTTPGPATAPLASPVPVAGGAPGTSAQAAAQALATSPSLAAYGLKVKEQNGRIVLTGSVHTAAEKELAGLTARDAAHAAVDNAIEIRP